MTTVDRRLVPEGRVALLLAAAVGRRQLQKMKRAGLPAPLHEPLTFLIERQLPEADYGPLDHVEALRTALAGREGSLAVFKGSRIDRPSMAGTPRSDERRPTERSFFDTAYVSSVTPVWGSFLYQVAKAASARTIVELGSAVGFSGCYLGSAPTCRRFVTVEGDPERARLAAAHLSGLVGHAEVLAMSFDDALERVLPTLRDGIDVAFIDGDKSRGSYVRFVDRLAPRLNPGAIVMFDDIQWADVQEDWQSLCQRPGLSFVVNAGRFGVCVRDPAAERPTVFTLFSAAGIDLYGIRRDLTALFNRIVRG